MYNYCLIQFINYDVVLGQRILCLTVIIIIGYTNSMASHTYFCNLFNDVTFAKYSNFVD